MTDLQKEDCPLFGSSGCMVGCECETCIMRFKGTPGESIGEHIRKSDDLLSDFYAKSVMSTLVTLRKGCMEEKDLEEFIKNAFNIYYTEFRLTMEARGSDKT